MTQTLAPQDFLDSATRAFEPAFKKRPRVAKKQDDGPVISFREAMVVEPPYSTDEKLPRTLIQADGEKILSLNRPQGHVYVEEISAWVPNRYEVMIRTIKTEIQDSKYMGLFHGTGTCFARGCRGPLCRRYRRWQEYGVSEYRATRLRAKLEQEAKESDRPLQRRVPRIFGTMYQRMKVAAPQYAAVDPLIVLFAIKEYSEIQDYTARGLHPEWSYLAQNPSRIPNFLFETYGRDVF